MKAEAGKKVKVKDLLSARSEKHLKIQGMNLGTMFKHCLGNSTPN